MAENCKFRNVLGDLVRIQGEMDSVPESPEEEKARNRLIQICRQMGALRSENLRKAVGESELAARPTGIDINSLAASVEELKKMVMGMTKVDKIDVDVDRS